MINAGERLIVPHPRMSERAFVCCRFAISLRTGRIPKRGDFQSGSRIGSRPGYSPLTMVSVSWHGMGWNGTAAELPCLASLSAYKATLLSDTGVFVSRYYLNFRACDGFWTRAAQL